MPYYYTGIVARILAWTLYLTLDYCSTSMNSFKCILSSNNCLKRVTSQEVLMAQPDDFSSTLGLTRVKWVFCSSNLRKETLTRVFVCVCVWQIFTIWNCFCQNGKKGFFGFSSRQNFEWNFFLTDSISSSNK
jgi:hypothetical protein